MDEKEIQDRLRNILEKSQQGLTYAEAGKKCGATWQRGVAKQFGSDGSTTEYARVRSAAFYKMWKSGVFEAEPPRPGKNGARIWHPDKFTKLRKPKKKRSPRKKIVKTSPAALEAAYREHLPRHPSGAVSIFKIRRSLENPSDFDQVLQSLSSRANSPIQLISGDPSAFSKDELSDCLTRNGKTYLRLIWNS